MSGIPFPTGNEEEDKSNWGKYTHPGDIHNSKCHDCFGAILWIILFAACLAILFFGISTGRPWALINSWDDTGNYCGHNNKDLADKITGFSESNFTLYDFSEYPVLFFGLPRATKITKEKIGEHQICVKECPSEDHNFTAALLDACDDSSRVCPSYLSQEEQNRERKPGGLCLCPYPTKLLFNRCMPIVESQTAEAITSNITEIIDDIEKLLNNIPGFGQSIASLVDLWFPILIASVLSLVVAFLWICLIGCCAGCIVYTVVILVPILIAALGFWLFFFGEAAFKFNNDNYNKYMAYALWGVAAIILLIVIFLFKKLRNAVQIVKISARALRKNFTVLLAPVFSLVFAIIFWAIIIVSCVYNYTATDFEIKDKNGKSFLSFSFTKSLQYLLIFNLIYVIFISVFVYFENYFAVSSSLVGWYFSDHSKGCCHLNWIYGFWLGFSKYIGTITASALIMTPLYLFIIFMEYLDAKSRQSPSKIGCFVRFLIKCMKCCLWCFEKIMKFLNKALLTVAQIYNRSWIKSASITMDIVLGDVIMTLLVTGVSTFILFLSKLVVASVTTLLFFFYLKYTAQDANGWIVPAVAVFVLSILISSFLINMYDSVIEIILICYQADRDLTNQGANRPMYITDDMSMMIEDLEQSHASNNKIEAESD
ncbi:hypothetical protein TRFO_34168 [Tritrichomonas foetus]|uniref:Choline transporter-like protein n=1 Tax=Tritrichomonas foetus TaxID=1144522 RepID=A0A1J4JJP9_9EUKA|nr:hypothetical protein TRFO_34168 [Tritrichomonas foetus]|eukprot:OHS99394.1 hypothetical protein TRFO_34168 [Tritrichomonas foetus]